MNFDLLRQNRGKIAIAVVVIIVLAVAAYYQFGTKEEGEGMNIHNPNTLIIQNAGGPETLDPAWAYDTASQEVIFNVYEPLIFFKGKKTDEYTSRIATEWEISDEGTTYRFKIRDGVKFHNGNELTPEDVEYSIERVMVMDRSGGPSWMLLEPLLGRHSTRKGENIVVDFQEIDQSVQVDGDWVVFNLDHVYPPFLGILAQSWASIVDKQWAIDQGAWPGTKETWKDYNNPKKAPLQDNMNGTGPFEFDRWEKGTQVVLKKNKDYWRDPASLESVKIQVVKEWSTRKSAFLAGDADIVYVPRAHSKEVTGENGIVVHENLPGLSTNPAAFYNFQINPKGNEYIGSGKLDGNGIPPDFFSDIHVRKAFTYAFDFQTYIDDAFLGQAKMVPGPIPSAMKYFNEEQETYSFNLEKAEEHFKKAMGGTVNDPGPVWENGFRLTILYNTGNTQRKVAAQIWEDKIESINDKFEIKIKSVKWDSYLGALVRRKLPLFIIGWAPDFPDPHNFVTPFMDSGGTFAKFQSYSNPHVDNLIDRGISTRNTQKRRQIYHELQKIYHNEVPSFPLCEPTVRRYHRSWVDGWYHNPMYPDSIYAYPLSKG